MYSHLAFNYILCNVSSIIGQWVESEKDMVPCVKLETLTLLLIKSCGRWGVPWVMGRWVASEKDMVPGVKLDTLTLLLITSCGRWGAPRVGELHLRSILCPDKVRYSHLAFNYILCNVRSIIGQWVESEKDMVPCVKLETLTLLLIKSCWRWGVPWVMGRWVASDKDMVPGVKL